MGEISKYSYKNKIMTVAELLALPECELSFSQLQNNLSKGIPAARAMLKKPIKKVVYKGVLYTVFELSKKSECVVDRPCLNSRIYSGWSIKKAMVTPKRQRLKNNRLEEVKEAPQFFKKKKKPVGPSKAQMKKIMAVPMKPTSTYSYWFKERLKR